VKSHSPTPLTPSQATPVPEVMGEQKIARLGFSRPVHRGRLPETSTMPLTTTQWKELMDVLVNTLTNRHS